MATYTLPNDVRAEKKPEGPLSLLWPLLLIAAGGLWLLVSLNILSYASLVVLLRLWPLLLIIVGVELLYGRQSQRLALTIGVVGILFLAGAAVVGPALGFGVMDVEEAAYTAPLENTASMNVALNLSLGKVTLNALADPTALIDADLVYVGEVEFVVRGDASKSVTLGQVGSYSTSIWEQPERPLEWDIALNPAVPLQLSINGGLGENDLDLREFTLTGLNLNAGMGALRLRLPSSAEVYRVHLNGGMGDSDIFIEDGALLNLDINAGMGNVVIHLPEGAAVRLETTSGMGSIRVPRGYVRVDNDTSREHRIWESPNFAEATHPIVITFNAGMGNLTVR